MRALGRGIGVTMALSLPEGRGQVDTRGGAPDNTRHAEPTGVAMRIGCSFPQSEIGADTSGIRAYAQAIEEMGYTHVTCGEHLVGVDTKRPGFIPRQGMPKDLRDIAYPYQEPLTFFAFLSGITKRIELLSSVLILPQRQTVLVAKQAAQVDNASGGRLRIGI